MGIKIEPGLGFFISNTATCSLASVIFAHHGQSQLSSLHDDFGPHFFPHANKAIPPLFPHPLTWFKTVRPSKLAQADGEG